MNNNPHQKLTRILYAGSVAILFVLWHGYRFNSGDLAEHLPQVYRMFNPALYPNDFFLSLYDQTFTVREYWVWLVYGCSVLLGVEWACFVLHVACIFLMVLAWMKITVEVTGEKSTQYIAPVLIFIVFNKFTVGGNTLQGVAFVSGIPAEVFASWGILYWLKEKKKTAVALFGLATLFQALIGLQWFLLTAFIQLCSSFTIKNIKFCIKLFLIYAIVALPMLLPVLQKQLLSHEVYDHELYYRILFVYRNVLHYIPSYFSLNDYLKFCTLLLIGVMTLKYQKANARVTVVKAVILAGIVGCVLYYVLLEWLHINAVGKLQWFKITVWINAFSCALISGVLVRYFNRIVLWLEHKLMLYAMSLFIVVGVFFMTNAALLPLKKLQNRYQVGNYVRTDLQKLHEWIRVNTPNDALFLVPPDDDGFNCEAQRPTPVNYKAVVHEPFFFMQWYEQMQRYYHVDFTKVGNNTALKQAISNYETLLKYPEHNLAQYRIDNLSTCTFADSLGTLIHKEGNWILTAIEQ